MSMSMVNEKSLIFDDPITLDGKVVYCDQNGMKTRLKMRKYVELAKKSKDKEYFKDQVAWIEDGSLTIGAFVISGLDRLAREFPEEVYEVLDEKI